MFQVNKACFYDKLKHLEGHQYPIGMFVLHLGRTLPFVTVCFLKALIFASLALDKQTDKLLPSPE